MPHYLTEPDGTLSLNCARERFNRVLYGSHRNDGKRERYFTFAGDTPVFLGASTDYGKDLFSFYAKNGMLLSGVALTPGFRTPWFYGPEADLSSAWFHHSRDIAMKWHHGWISYELSQVSPWFPEMKCAIEVYPLSPDDGFAVHYDLEADGRILFTTGFGGITGFLGRFEYSDSPARDYRVSDSDGCEVVLDSPRQALLRGGGAGGDVTMRIGFGFDCEIRKGPASALALNHPGMFLAAESGNAKEGEIVRMVRPLDPGEKFSGWIVVGRDLPADRMRDYLEDPGLGEKLRAAIRSKHEPSVSMKTPDLQLDSIIPDTVIAHDASYHAPTFHHGAHGYHTPFLGWRGWYAPTLLGWNDRVRGAIAAHLRTALRPDGQAERVWYDGADRPELDHVGTQYHHLEHTYGKLTALLYRDDIYNMSELAVNMMLYYFDHVSDDSFARECFDAMSGILDWEERILKDGETGLYQNFLNTWISDGHSCNGGGCAQASCYNLLANRLMGKLARKIGRDGTRFDLRAAEVGDSIRKHLWLEKDRVLAEFVDTVGNKLIHPSPELSTVYLAVECEALDREELLSCLKFTEKHIRSVSSPDRKGRLSFSSNWLPKKYSTCGLFPAENAALALAYFSLGEGAGGRRILDALIDCYFNGTNPGQTRHVVSSRCGEEFADLDFTDVSGTILRMVFEGLWGVRTHLLDDLFEFAPQLYPDWSDASLRLADGTFSFHRSGDGTAHWTIDVPKCPASRRRFRFYPVRESAAEVRLNGSPAKYTEAADGSLLIDWSGILHAEISIRETGSLRKPVPTDEAEKPMVPPRDELPGGSFEFVDLRNEFNEELEKLHQRKYLSPRPEKYSIGVQINGRYAWEWTHCGHNAIQIDTTNLRKAPEGVFRTKSGLPFQLPPEGRNLLAVSIWENFPTRHSVRLSGRARGIAVLAAGVTNAMQSYVPNAACVLRYADGSERKLVLVNPVDFDDWLLPAYQRRFESVYFSGFNHAFVIPLRTDPGKELAEIAFEGIANEVVFGILGITLIR